MRFWLLVPLLLVLVALWACSSLPSETPLGLGPQALAEARLEQRNEARARARSEAGDEGDEVVEVEADSSGTDEARDAGADSRAAEGPKVAEADAGSKTEAGDAGAAESASFAGYYLGSDVTVWRLERLPVQEEEDPNAKLSVEQAGRELVLEIINSLNDETLCELKATLKDGAANEAELTPGQACFGDPSRGLDVNIASGSVTLDDDELTLELAGEIKLSGGDGRQIGTVDYHFEGTRK